MPPPAEGIKLQIISLILFSPFNPFIKLLHCPSPIAHHLIRRHIIMCLRATTISHKACIYLRLWPICYYAIPTIVSSGIMYQRTDVTTRRNITIITIRYIFTVGMIMIRHFIHC